MKSILYFVDDIDTPFVRKDIEILASGYERLLLFSSEPLNGKELLPDNVITFENYIRWKHFNGGKIFFRHFFQICLIYLKESLSTGRWPSFRKSVALLCSNRFKAGEILRSLDENGIQLTGQTVCYSFWFYDCIYLAWLKKIKDGFTAFSRAHSGDLYEEHISIRNKILFRHFQLQKLDGLFPVSRTGTEYLKIKYPDAAEKIQTFYLGTDDPGTLNSFNEGQFVMVSCASFRHHKRIHKIAETLLNIKFPVTWYHFGNENLDTNDPKIPEYKRMKEDLKKNKLVTYHPMGQISNEQLFEFYRSTPVSLFISLSAAEGIPVSIMEAISFGIPVLSTDVGGCREIVNERTGILIPLSETVTEIAWRLENFADSEMNSEEFRKGVRNFWEDHFDASKNYEGLLKLLNRTNS